MSRLARLPGARRHLSQLTRDHTLVQSLVDDGQISPQRQRRLIRPLNAHGPYRPVARPSRTCRAPRGTRRPLPACSTASTCVVGPDLLHNAMTTLAEPARWWNTCPSENGCTARTTSAASSRRGDLSAEPGSAVARGHGRTGPSRRLTRWARRLISRCPAWRLESGQRAAPSSRAAHRSGPCSTATDDVFSHAVAGEHADQLGQDGIVAYQHHRRRVSAVSWITDSRSSRRRRRSARRAGNPGGRRLSATRRQVWRVLAAGRADRQVDAGHVRTNHRRRPARPARRARPVADRVGDTAGQAT